MQPFDEIATADWPMVQIRILRAPVEDHEIDTFQARFTAILQEASEVNERIFLLFNLDGIVQATFPQQYRASTLIKDIRHYVSTSIAATALVATSAVARTVLKVVMALQPLQSVNCVFNNEQDALEWLAANRARVEAGADAVVDVLGPAAAGDDTNELSQRE